MEDTASFDIWVDADSCPVQARELTVRFALRLKLKVHFVANRPIPCQEGSLFDMVVCEATQDAADDHIVANIGANDLAITRDIPLASRLVHKGVCVINDRGTIFTEDNISEKLAARDLNYMLVENGILPASERNTSYGKKEANLFANSLDKVLQKKLKALQQNEKQN